MLDLTVGSQTVDSVFTFTHPDVPVCIFNDIIDGMDRDGKAEAVYGEFVPSDGERT